MQSANLNFFGNSITYFMVYLFITVMYGRRIVNMILFKGKEPKQHKFTNIIQNFVTSPLEHKIVIVKCQHTKLKVNLICFISISLIT